MVCLAQALAGTPNVALTGRLQRLAATEHGRLTAEAQAEAKAAADAQTRRRARVLGFFRQGRQEAPVLVADSSIAVRL